MFSKPKNLSANIANIVFSLFPYESWAITGNFKLDDNNKRERLVVKIKELFKLFYDHELYYGWCSILKPYHKHALWHVTEVIDRAYVVTSFFINRGLLPAEYFMPVILAAAFHDTLQKHTAKDKAGLNEAYSAELLEGFYQEFLTPLGVFNLNKQKLIQLSKYLILITTPKPKLEKIIIGNDIFEGISITPKHFLEPAWVAKKDLKLLQLIMLIADLGSGFMPNTSQLNKPSGATGEINWETGLDVELKSQLLFLEKLFDGSLDNLGNKQEILKGYTCFMRENAGLLKLKNVNTMLQKIAIANPKMATFVLKSEQPRFTSGLDDNRKSQFTEKFLDWQETEVVFLHKLEKFFQDRLQEIARMDKNYSSAISILEASLSFEAAMQSYTLYKHQRNLSFEELIIYHIKKITPFYWS